VSVVEREQHGDGAGPQLARLETIGAHLDAVEAALAALDDGSYGRCRRCGQPIADEILGRDPLAGDCGEHRLPVMPPGEAG